MRLLISEGERITVEGGDYPTAAFLSLILSPLRNAAVDMITDRLAEEAIEIFSSDWQIPTKRQHDT